MPWMSIPQQARATMRLMSSDSRLTMTTPFTAKTETEAGEGEEFEVLMISGDDERPG